MKIALIILAAIVYISIGIAIGVVTDDGTDNGEYSLGTAICWPILVLSMGFVKLFEQFIKK